MPTTTLVTSLVTRLAAALAVAGFDLRSAVVHHEDGGSFGVFLTLADAEQVTGALLTLRTAASKTTAQVRWCGERAPYTIVVGGRVQTATALPAAAA